VLSQKMHTSGPGRETSPTAPLSPTPRRGEAGGDPVPLLHPPPWRGMLVATVTRCKQQEDPNPGSTRFAASGEPAAFPRFRAIHRRPRLFAAILWPGPTVDIGDVLGVLGLPQSTAGRRYEISIYILQPGQESDNLTAKLRGEQSSLERLVGADSAGRVPRVPGT